MSGLDRFSAYSGNIYYYNSVKLSWSRENSKRILKSNIFSSVIFLVDSIVFNAISPLTPFNC
jgi:hypothetical protein